MSKRNGILQKFEDVVRAGGPAETYFALRDALEIALDPEPDLPADLAQQLVDAGLPTELDALWEFCQQRIQLPGRTTDIHPRRHGRDHYIVDAVEWHNDIEATGLPPGWDLIRQGFGETLTHAMADLALALHAKAGGES